MVAGNPHFSRVAEAISPHGSCAPIFDRLQYFRDDFIAWLGAEVALTVHADSDGISFEIAIADDEHGVDFHLLGVR
jgi:hypothetical protein